MCTLHRYRECYKIQPKHCVNELLVYAIKHDYVDITKYVLNILTNTFAQIENLFEIGVLHYSIQCVEYLYEEYRYQWDIECICSYIVYAINENYIDIVYYLIDKDEIDIYYNNCQFLIESVNSNNKHLLQYILDLPRMDNPSYYNNNVLIHAIESRNHPIINTIVKHPKVHVHEPDNEPFRVAMDIGDKWIITKLYNDRWVQQTLQLDEEEKYRLDLMYF